MAAQIKPLTDRAPQISTAFMLGLRYQSPYIPLATVINDFMPHLDLSMANRRANAKTLPFPAFKIDGAKSPFMVSVADLAAYLDAQRTANLPDWQAARPNQ